MPKKKKYRRTKTVHKSFVADNDVDKHFVSAEQVDKAHQYLVEKKSTMSPVICLSDKVLAKKVFARINMPKAPEHYPQKTEPTTIGCKNRLTSLLSMVGL